MYYASILPVYDNFYQLLYLLYNNILIFFKKVYTLSFPLLCMCMFSLPVVSDFFNTMNSSMPGRPVPHHPWILSKFMFIALVMPSNHLILWALLFSLPSVFPNIRDFSNESAICIKWQKCQSFSFGISPSEEYSELISLKTFCFDLFSVQGALRSLL